MTTQTRRVELEQIMEKIRRWGGVTIKYVILIGFAIWSITPVMVVVLTSFKTQMDIFETPFKLFFRPTFINYINAFLTGDFSNYFKNSLLIAVASSLISIFFGAFAAYGITSFNLRRAKLFSNLFLVGKLVPAITILLPLFIILNSVKLLGSYVGPILAHTAINLPFVVWLLMSFINDIPPDLLCCAQIDGCNRMQVFWKIIFPILSPALASATILAMQLSWNELLFSLQLTNLDSYTLPVGIAKFVGSVSVDWGKSSAAATLTMIPIIILGFFIQKYMVRGMTMGSVKG
jgi:multiple sugar transport system permease protein